MYRELCHLENIYFIRPGFLRKAELTNLDISVEQRKSILHHSPESEEYSGFCEIRPKLHS